MSKTSLLIDRIFERHTTGPGHPESPERYDAVMQAVEQVPALKDAPRIPVRHATEDEIALCHSSEYLGIVKQDITRGLRDLSTGDTAIGSKSLDVALRAVGGVLNAVDQIVNNHTKRAFCAVRPPGHHATPTRGMGFCIFNNIAIAARYAMKKHGLERILIIDWDVHHGNGTQEIFYQDGSVLFFSTHQFPWYPGTGRREETGEGKARNRIINRPLPAGAGWEEIGEAFRSAMKPAAETFRPDMVMISAGFDSRAGDPLGRFTLTDEDFVELTEMLLEIADKHSGGRILSVLEGGYSLPALRAGVAAHAGRLAR